MGEETSGKTGGKSAVASFQGTLYDKPGMTVETYAVLNSVDIVKSNFDVLDEALGARVGSGARDLRIRVDTFLKPRADDGILLGYAVSKLVQNLDDFKAGHAPNPPQAGEPGSELVRGGGYEGWFAHTGDCYRHLAENLDKRTGGKFEHVVDLEKRPSGSDIEKLPDGEFSKLYGFTKERFLQKDGIAFETKYGEDKLRFLQEHVLKRLTWEEDMMLKEVEDSIYTNSTYYGPSADAPTASRIVSHVYGLSCGDDVDFSALASDPDSGEQREQYWKLVDEKLKDARFMREDDFAKKWETSKDAFVDEIVPELHRVYNKVISATIARMDAKELKDRYYLSELRGDELIGELLGGTHSIGERVTELEAHRDELTRYMSGFSKKIENFEKTVDGRDELRDNRLVELKKRMSDIEQAHPEVAFVENGIFKQSVDGQALTAASEGKPASGYNLKNRRDNPYLTYLSYRNELKEEKKTVDALAAELGNLKNTLEKTDGSSLDFRTVKALLDTVNATKTAHEDTGEKLAVVSSPQKNVNRLKTGKIEQGGGEIVQDGEFGIKIPEGYLEKELNIGELEKLEARINEIRKIDWNTCVESGSVAKDRQEADQKWEAYKQKIDEQEKTILPEIEAAKEKWKEQALLVVKTELERQEAMSARISPDIDRLDREVSYIENKLGINDYNRLKARQKELEAEFPVEDNSKSAKVIVIRKLAFDALAIAEEKVGKEEYRKLEERRKELKENPDPALKAAALKEIGILEERLGLAPYKKLEERRKEIESEIQNRLGTGVYTWIKARKEELEKLIDVAELDTNKEYQGFKAHGEKLEGNIRRAALKDIENLEKELGITEYTDLETAKSGLTDRIDELKKIQLIPEEIETKRREIENKEGYIEVLSGEIENIEKKFMIRGYARTGLLEERIRRLKENLPSDPALRKLALKGIIGGGRKGVNLRGVELVERDLELVKYDKNVLENGIKELESKLPKDLQLELENLEKTKEQLRLSKEKWMATHGVGAFEKWKDAHGVIAYKGLVDEERIIEKTRTNDYWALKDAYDTTAEINKKLKAVDLELGHLKNRLADDRQLPELRDMLWGRGKYSDAPVSMAVFNGLYTKIEELLPDESKKLVDIAKKNIKTRAEWMGSHPSVRDQKKLAAERAAFEFDMLSQNGPSFSWNPLVAESGNAAGLREFTKGIFGIELPETATIKTIDNGKTVNLFDGDDKQIASVWLYNYDELAMLETADGRVEKLRARPDPKTGELVIFPYVQPDIIMKKMYDRAHKKSE